MEGRKGRREGEEERKEKREEGRKKRRKKKHLFSIVAVIEEARTMDQVSYSAL